jgi:multicomponent Na+:H+ antiporter subunit G
VLGLLFQAGLSLISVKLFLIIVFILFTSPAAAHALAKAAIHGNLEPLLPTDGEQPSKN